MKEMRLREKKKNGKNLVSLFNHIGVFATRRLQNDDEIFTNPEKI
jgi:hypothetical protein